MSGGHGTCRPSYFVNHQAARAEHVGVRADAGDESGGLDGRKLGETKGRRAGL